MENTINNNNIEVNNNDVKKETIEMANTENIIATDTAITGAQATIENNAENDNLEGIEMKNEDIKAIETKALEAATAAAQAKNAYEKISREKKAVTELNKLFSAKKGVASAINQIANNNYRKAAAELAIAHLNNVVTDFFTEKKLAAHNKRLATQNAKIAAANAKIAIYREKLVAANDKLVAFNEAEIVAAALAVLNDTAITPVVAPVVVAPAPVVETVDVDAVLAKVNTAVIAARDAANKEHMLKSVKKFAALRDEINAPIFDFNHINDVNVAIEMIATKARNVADMAAIDDYIVSATAQESAIMAEIEAANFVSAEKLEANDEIEEILSCGDGDDVEEISEEDRIAAMSDWNPDEVFDPKELLEEEEILSSAEFENEEVETVAEENTSAPSLENKSVVGTVEEPKTEEIPAALAALNNLEAELLGKKQVEEPKVEVKAAAAPVDPIAEARRKMRELMAKKAGKPVDTETVEKKGSAEEPKAPTKEDEALAREAEAYQKAKAIEEEIYASYDPKTKQYGAYMPKTMKLRKNAQEVLYNAFHSENADTHTTAASIWDTIGDETPEIVDPYAPYVAPKAVRTETRYLNVKEYENGEMALPEDSDEAKANPAGANYDDIMAACGY